MVALVLGDSIYIFRTIHIKNEISFKILCQNPEQNQRHMRPNGTQRFSAQFLKNNPAEENSGFPKFRIHLSLRVQQFEENQCHMTFRLSAIQRLIFEEEFNQQKIQIFRISHSPWRACSAVRTAPAAATRASRVRLGTRTGSRSRSFARRRWAVFWPGPWS